MYAFILLVDKLYARHVKHMQEPDIDALMNGPIRDKLMIIPNDVKWGGKYRPVKKERNTLFFK